MNPRNVSQSVWVGLWSALPSGPDGEFKTIINGLTCSQKLKMASVCKTWLKLIESDEMGEEPLGERNLTPRLGCSWISVCRMYLMLPQTIIAVDKSASMNDVSPKGKGFTNLEIAIQKACNIIAHLGPALARNGVDCIVFGSRVLAVKVFSVEDACEFFISDQYTGGGTSFNDLFLKIFEIQKRYSDQKRVLTTTTHIFSDFDEQYLCETLFEEHGRTNIHFNCHRFALENKRKGEDFQDNFQKRIRVEEEGMQICTRSSKKRVKEKRMSCTFSLIKPQKFVKKQSGEPKNL